MAYDKHTWTCDEPITVERLNHIEDGIANAGGDCGFECEEEWVTLAEETVTTTEQGGHNGAQLSYSQFIDAETIRVTFDGVEYECERLESSGGYIYGGFSSTPSPHPDFSQYPFTIRSRIGIGNFLVTETAGTYAVKIEGMHEVVTTTSCFAKAVQATIFQMGLSPLILTQSGSPAQLDRTFEEISDAYLNGRTVLLDPPNASNLKATSGKNYYSMVSLETDSAIGDVQSGGSIVFGGRTTRIFSASSASDYPASAT